MPNPIEKTPEITIQNASSNEIAENNIQEIHIALEHLKNGRYPGEDHITEMTKN